MDREYFKRITIMVYCCLLMATAGCTSMSERLADFQEKVESYPAPDKRKSNAVMLPLLTALEDKDVDAVKALFSDYALENSENLDDKIQELMDFYPGYDVEEYDPLVEMSESYTLGVGWKMLSPRYNFSKDGQTHIWKLILYTENNVERDKVGLYSVQVMIEEEKPDGFRWRGEEDGLGIFVLE